jgi:hypothetical protein
LAREAVGEVRGVRALCVERGDVLLDRGDVLRVLRGDLAAHRLARGRGR